ncbi:FHA domain-containing protein [Citricoccus sp. CH26A]|uniref:FHA domain-containing protein n=1 Tax=Citricoccus sp. CH26A TaxID=1045009 RepID=UPI000255ED75|nr:FHA domain-containing protein [Citricoccus sp. CH26A]
MEHLLATVLSGRLDLTGMPAFAIVSYAGQDVHAILRGDVHLRMTGVDDIETRLSGTGVSTWAERIVPGVRSFELLVDDALPDAEDLPLEAGAVRLAALQADLVSAASGNPEPCPERRAADHLAPSAAPTPAAPLTGPGAPSEPGRATDPVPPAESADVRDGAVTEDGEDGAGHAAPSLGEQPDGESDIDMTIAPDTAEYLSSPSASDAPESSGRTTLVQPAEDGTASREETDVEAPSETGPGEDVERGTVADPAPASAASAASAPVRPASRAPEPQELIDSVPWLAAARRAVPAPEQPGAGGPDWGRPDEGRPDGGSPVPTVPAEPGRAGTLGAHPEDDVDADTVLSPSAAALAAAGPTPADRTPAPPSEPAPGIPTAVPADPDHDGETVMRSDLDLAGVETVGPAVPEAPASPATGPMVLARQCSIGHANPPTSSTCARCGQSLGGEARQVRRPALGRIRMSTGEVLELDRPVVIGRQPQAHRVGSGTMPRMIQVRSPHGDISRSHCEVVLEGWHVQLRDLKATNGTVLIREGAAPAGWARARPSWSWTGTSPTSVTASPCGSRRFREL